MVLPAYVTHCSPTAGFMDGIQCKTTDSCARAIQGTSRKMPPPEHAGTAGTTLPKGSDAKGSEGLDAGNLHLRKSGRVTVRG
eukprot:6387486-Pyramimonas_sp.AAC.2